MGIEVSIYNVCYQGVVLQYVHTIPTVLYTTQPLMHTPPSLSLSHCNIEILLKGNYKIGKRLSLIEHQYIFPYRKHDE